MCMLQRSQIVYAYAWYIVHTCVYDLQKQKQ